MTRSLLTKTVFEHRANDRSSGHVLRLVVTKAPGQPPLTMLGEHTLTPETARELAHQLQLAADAHEAAQDPPPPIGAEHDHHPQGHQGVPGA